MTTFIKFVVTRIVASINFDPWMNKFCDCKNYRESCIHTDLHIDTAFVD